MSKSVLRSKPLPRPYAGDFESLQLSESLTFAEESFRRVVAFIHPEETLQWIRREIILPTIKQKPKTLRDHDGHVLKGELTNMVARKKWDELSVRQRDMIYTAGSLAYLATTRDDFEMRTVCFKASVVTRKSASATTRMCIAVVTAHSLSGSWNLARVKLWDAECLFGTAPSSPKYLGGEFSVTGDVHAVTLMHDSRPPKFLL